MSEQQQATERYIHLELQNNVVYRVHPRLAKYSKTLSNMLEDCMDSEPVDDKVLFVVPMPEFKDEAVAGMNAFLKALSEDEVAREQEMLSLEKNRQFSDWSYKVAREHFRFGDTDNPAYVQRLTETLLLAEYLSIETLRAFMCALLVHSIRSKTPVQLARMLGVEDVKMGEYDEYKLRKQLEWTPPEPKVLSAEEAERVRLTQK